MTSTAPSREQDALEIRKHIGLARIAARRAGKILQDIRVGEYANASAQIPKRCIYHETKELNRSRKSSVHALWRIMFLAASIAGKRMIWRHRVGSRFAAAHPLPACGSTAELAQALNAYWQQMAWDYVELVDEPESLRIVHYCAPLQAFGDTALAWTPAFLEGVYQIRSAMPMNIASGSRRCMCDTASASGRPRSRSRRLR